MDTVVHGAVVNGQQPPEWKSVTTTVSLAAYERNVKVTACAASFDITLPPMGEALNRGIYWIKRTVAAGGGFEATVKSKEIDGGGALFTSDGLSAANDVLALVTDGERWYALYDVTT